MFRKIPLQTNRVDIFCLRAVGLDALIKSYIGENKAPEIGKAIPQFQHRIVDLISTRLDLVRIGLEFIVSANNP